MYKDKDLFRLLEQFIFKFQDKIVKSDCGWYSIKIPNYDLSCNNQNAILHHDMVNENNEEIRRKLVLSGSDSEKIFYLIKIFYSRNDKKVYSNDYYTNQTYKDLIDLVGD